MPYVDIKIDGLTCEYLNNPLGLDAKQPRLSWMMVSSRRGEVQTAYQVLVASTEQALLDGEADLWDSGKVLSDQSLHVVYNGKPLTSDIKCWWKVRVWDKDGHASAWSDNSFWTMGLLAQSDWKTRWIAQSLVLPPEAFHIKDARWIWFPYGDPKIEAPAGTRYFRKVIDVRPDSAIEDARFWVTADNSCTVLINGNEIGHTDDCRQLHIIDAKAYIAPGKNVLAIAAVNDATSPAGLIGKLVIGLDSAETVTANTDKTWLTSDTETPDWTHVDFDAAQWQESMELGEEGCKPWGHFSRAPLQGFPAPYFRKDLDIVKSVKSACIHICGPGYHELRLNGRKVGDHVLEPNFTDYTKRALYVTYDVADALNQGENALGVILGNGWYNSGARDVWDFDRAPWRNTPRFILQMKIEYVDGSVETIVSDATWSTSTGQITFTGIRNGETFDARLENPGWDTPGYADQEWHSALEVDGPAGKLVAQNTLSNRITKTLKPVGLTEPKPGIFVFDMGQNLAGWARIAVSGPAGTSVTLKYDERLNPDGTLDQINWDFIYTGPFQTDTYILNGQGTEVWEPRFVYHGFQYVQVEGFPGQPTLDSLTACVIHTDFDEAGAFECSNELLNKIQQNTLWSYIGNFVAGFPTDCPHREKNGWTGDAGLAAETGLYNFNPQSNYTGWINDFADAQLDNGELPGIVPTSGWGYGHGPAWDSAFILIPWYMYLYSGDTRILEEHFDAFKRYVGFLSSKAENHIVSYGLGDWCPPIGNAWDHEAPSALTSTAYYYMDCRIMADIARVLGNAADAARYAELAEAIKDAFNEKFYDSDNGVYAGEDQTAMAIAIYQGLVPPDQKDRVMSSLLKEVDRHDGHVFCGILGTKYVMHALADNGRTDVAYGMANKRTFPSWGYWIEQGATTLWEHWDGILSRNHIMFGDISAWFFKELAGISPGAPGFKHVIVRPHPVCDLRWVNAGYTSMYGRIEIAWKSEHGSLSLAVEIPANTSADIYMPSIDTGSVSESGQPLNVAEGVKQYRHENGCTVITVGSGSYRFTAQG